MPLTNPPLIPEAFAALGDKNTIPDAPGAPGAASWDSGFPVETEEPLTSGGIPPDRLDVNGVLFSMSQHTAFLQAGGVYQWDSGIGASPGYTKGAMVASSSGESIYVSLIDSNTHNPNSSPGFWSSIAGPLAGESLYGTCGTGDTNAYTITRSFTVPALADGAILFFTLGAANSNTGACTITLSEGGGTHAFVRSDGAAMQSGDLVVGPVYMAMFRGTTWNMIGPVASQLPAPPAPPALFGTIHDVTGSRTLGTTYTNTSSL